MAGGAIPPGTADPVDAAAALLTLIEGVIVMDSLGQSAVVGDRFSR